MSELERRPQDDSGPSVATESEHPAAASSTTILGQVGAQVGAPLLQRKLLQRRLLQRRGAGSGHDDAATHDLAARGTSGAGGALPHLDTIQKSFGKHDVSNVQAHTDGAATSAATAIGAEAYATGSHVAFADTPSLHTAAHEAAHVVQQRSGVHLKGGVGEEGDSYERHADAVADRVVRGESAEALLDQHAGGGAATSQAPTQRKVQLRGGKGRRSRAQRRQGGGAKSTALTVYNGGRPTPGGATEPGHGPSSQGGDKSTALTVHGGPTPTGATEPKSTALVPYGGPTPKGPGEGKSTALVPYGGDHGHGEHGDGASTALVPYGATPGPSGEEGSPTGPESQPLLLADKSWAQVESDRHYEKVGMGIDAGADLLDLIEAVAKAKEGHDQGDKAAMVGGASGALGAGISGVANLGGATSQLASGTVDKMGGTAGALKLVNQGHEVYGAIKEAWEEYSGGGFSEDLAIKAGAVVEKVADAAGSALAVAKVLLEGDAAATLGPLLDTVKRVMVIFERVLQAHKAWQRWGAALKDKDTGRGRHNERRIKAADDQLAELNRDRWKQDLLDIVVNGAGLAGLATGPVGMAGAKALDVGSRAYMTGLRTAREWKLWWTDQSKTSDGRRTLAQEIVTLGQAHLFELAGAKPGGTVDEVHQALMRTN